MTLWNPLHVFSNDERQKANLDVSSSFDPSRTGDPLDAGSTQPSIGFGDARLTEPSHLGGSRRHPIGFAPSDGGDEPRYRTEISFKRHHELPRASATPEQPEGSAQAWQTPQHGIVDPVSSDSSESEGILEPEIPAADTAPAEEKVSFFKRELSFRRKHTVPDEVPDADVADETDDPGQADGSEILAASAEDGAAEHDQPELGDTPQVVAEADEVSTETADDPAPEEPGEIAEVVPFYKREISFRRKGAAVAASAAVVESQELADSAVDTSAGETEQHPEESMPSAAVAAEPAPAEREDLAWAVAPSMEAEPVADPHEEDAAADSVASDATHDVAGWTEAALTDATSETLTDDASADTDPDAALADLAEPAGEEDGLDHSIAAAVAVAQTGDADEPVVSAVSDDVVVADPSSSNGHPRKQASAKRKQGRGGKGRRVVGLKIGASQLAAAVVSKTEAGHELVELARRPLAAGIVVDGEVRDIDALAKAVKSFFDDEKLPKKDVRIGLASNRIGVRTFDIVGIDDDERFDNAVRFRAHEVLPVAAHESVLDYRVLEERPNEAGEQMRRVLLVVAPRDQVEPYAEVARRAGIKLAGLDLEALALLRAFVEPKPFAARAVDDTATVVVSIGHESSTLLVAGGGVCEFTRVFDWGGSALEEAIAASLDVHPAEAATILRHLSLSGPGRQFDGLDAESRAAALEAVRIRLTPFARELVASLQFYQTQDESLGIGGIVITGGTSHLEGIEEALHQMIGVGLTVGDPLARVIPAGDFDPAIESVIGSMAVPIGLAIDDLAMREVNLLPKDEATSKSRRSSMISIAAPVAVAIPLVALGLLYVGAHGKVSDNQKELDAVSAEIAALPKPQGPTLDPGINGEQAVRATAIASVLGSRLEWDGVLRDMARVLPATVWLKSLSASLPEAGNLPGGATAPVAATIPGQPAPTPTAVRIDGYTYTQPDVARLLARLGTLPSLKSVTLTSSAQETVEGKDVIHFVIVADLNGGAS